jgi:predicted transcriptional regulator
MQFHLPPEVIQQVDDLSRALHIPRSSVVSQAIARWYSDEPLVRDPLVHRNVDEKKKRKRLNGNRNA